MNNQPNASRPLRVRFPRRAAGAAVAAARPSGVTRPVGGVAATRGGGRRNLPHQHNLRTLREAAGQTWLPYETRRQRR